MCVTDCHDMTLAVKVALNPKSTQVDENLAYSTLHRKILENMITSNNIIMEVYEIAWLSSSLLIFIYLYSVCKGEGQDHSNIKARKGGKRTAFNTFPNKPWFLRVCRISLLKTLWEKEKLLVMSNFSFSHSVFYPFGELSAIFITFEIVVCKLLEFGRI